MKIQLSINDERVGTPERRPKTDLLGRPYTWPPNNRQQLKFGRYVILPQLLTEPIEVEIVETPADEPDLVLDGSSIAASPIAWEITDSTAVDSEFPAEEIKVSRRRRGDEG